MEQPTEQTILDAAERNRIQHEKMTGTPIARLIITLSIPTIISMLVSAIYNIADTYFVSQLGTSASGAVGISFSVMAIIQAVGFTLGAGSGSLVARRLGARDDAAADTYASSAFFAALLLGAVIAAIGLSDIEGLMRLLGATPTILPYARDYAQYILLGAPFMCASFVMNNVLRSQGRAVLSMIGLATGGAINLALDPIFIFNLGLGTAGAAIATLISQCVSFTILLSMFLRGKSFAKLSFKRVSLRLATYVDIVTIGFPSMCRQGLASIATVLLNTSAAVYGDAAVAAMAIVARVYSFVLFVGLGIGQGSQPVIGYNYGARRFDRVRESYRFTMLVGFAAIGVVAIAGCIFAPEVIRLFRRDDPTVVAIGTLAMRLQCLALLITPITVGTNMLLQATGKAAPATFLACCRQGIFFIPLILVLPRVIGLTGIQIAQAISDALSCCVSLPFAIAFFKRLRVQEREEGAKDAPAAALPQELEA